MRIIGFDPGYDRLGWAVIDTNNTPKPSPVANGCILTDKKESIAKRYLQIITELQEVVTAHQPTAAAIESLFFNTNQTTALRVSECRGLIFAAILPSGCTVAEYTPLQIKQAVTGYGRADKAAVSKMIQLQLELKKLPKYDDTIDALAVAFTHSLVYKQVTE
ncbi:MAG: crossover junction endodeoxyribonuclease RuvC [Patescibacteria group bacterium]